MGKACWIGVLMVFALLCGKAQAESLDEDLAALKADVAKLNAALFELEEDILYPANTQLAVFLSLEDTDLFQLDSVEVMVDGNMATSHLYTEQEREALKQGAIQRLYLGNLSPGEHQITATLNGKGVNDHYYRKQQRFTVTKEDDAERVELVISTQTPSHEPGFRLKQWQ